MDQFTLLAKTRWDGDAFTFQADAVALQTLHGLFEEILACRGHAGDIVLLPFDGCVNIVENLLDGVSDFSTDTITGDERDLMGEINDAWDKSVGYIQCRHRRISSGTGRCEVTHKIFEM